jgi:hypothetical protein
MDERVWTDAPLAEGAVMTGDGVAIRRVAPGAMALISGDLDAAGAALAPGAAMVGLGARSDMRPVALRIARDRALLLTDAPVTAGGWFDPGFAVSPAEGLYACLSITGPGARALIAEGTSVDPDGASPSAAVLFADCPCLLSGTADGWLLWVEAPMLTYLTGWLAGRCAP